MFSFRNMKMQFMNHVMVSNIVFFEIKIKFYLILYLVLEWKNLRDEVNALLSELNDDKKASSDEKPVLYTTNYSYIPFSSSGEILLPVILLFSEFSLTTNLLCSPDINFRKVNQSNYHKKDEYFQQTLEENAFAEKGNDTFQASSIHLTAFRQSIEEKDNNKIVYESVCKGGYVFKDGEELDNTLVKLENVIVNPVNENTIHNLGLILDTDFMPYKQSCEENEALIFDFSKLLSCFQFMKKMVIFAKKILSICGKVLICQMSLKM